MLATLRVADSTLPSCNLNIHNSLLNRNNCWVLISIVIHISLWIWMFSFPSKIGKSKSSVHVLLAQHTVCFNQYKPEEKLYCQYFLYPPLPSPFIDSFSNFTHFIFPFCPCFPQVKWGFPIYIFIFVCVNVRMNGDIIFRKCSQLLSYSHILVSFVVLLVNKQIWQKSHCCDKKKCSESVNMCVMGLFFPFLSINFAWIQLKNSVVRVSV